MDFIQYYFYIIKIIIIIGLLLMYTGVISYNRPLFLILDTLFKVSLGVYMIYYFSNKNKLQNMDSHNRLLFMMAGFILLVTINYEGIYKMITGYDDNKPECQNTIEVVSKPCPPCSEQSVIQGRLVKYD